MGGYDLGDIQSVNSDKVITKKGLIEGDNFFLPKSWEEPLFDRHKDLLKS
jgi:hypothetical protein